MPSPQSHCGHDNSQQPTPNSQAVSDWENLGSWRLDVGGYRVSLLDFVRGATFDDFLFTQQSSVIERRDTSAVDTTCRFSTGLTLKRPIVSANMNTVTRSDMAIAIAEEGGIGIIDRGFRSGEIEPQVREVEIVKRRQ